MTIGVKTSSRSQMVDITGKVEDLIPKDIDRGVCHLLCMHTTAGLTVNENADPSVCSDMLGYLDRLVPWNDPHFTHCEGNSAAHIKASFMGASLAIPFESGRLKLGRWQGIYFCEFDGPRSRTVEASFTKSA